MNSQPRSVGNVADFFYLMNTIRVVDEICVLFSVKLFRSF